MGLRNAVALIAGRQEPSEKMNQAVSMDGMGTRRGRSGTQFVENHEASYEGTHIWAGPGQSLCCQRSILKDNEVPIT